MPGAERRGLASVRAGVRFHPGAAPAVLGLLVSELARPFELGTGHGIDGVPGRQPIASPPGIGAAKCVTERNGLKRASPADLLGLGA